MLFLRSFYLSFSSVEHCTFKMAADLSQHIIIILLLSHFLFVFTFNYIVSCSDSKQQLTIDEFKTPFLLF